MHFTIKPTSFTCNLNCDYCFYLPKGNSYLKKAKMQDDILEIFIKKYINASDDRVYFTWQGGEPLLMGLDFYKKVIALQDKYKGSKYIENAIQTNGTLLNDDFCKFIKDNNILIGISIDGPEAIHDVYRRTLNNKGSFKEVMAGLEKLQKHNIEFNTLTCINKANYDKGLLVYKFLKDIGSTYMQFSEVIETNPEMSDFNNPPLVFNKKDFALDPKDYATFMSDIFTYWVKHDIGTIVVRQFENFISTVLGTGALSCVFENKCCDNFVLEANGDIYECDQAVYDKYKLGNIKDIDLSSIHSYNINTVKEKLSDDCLSCMYKKLCNGGCPKHRLIMQNGVSKTYFCEGYKQLFKTMVPYLNAMVALTDNKIPYIKVKDVADKIASIS